MAVLTMRGLLAIALLLLTADAVKFKEYFTDFKRNCLGKCQRSTLPDEFNENVQNCAYKCVSEECYNQNFAHRPPAPGKATTEQLDDFRICVWKQAVDSGMSFEGVSPKEELERREERAQKQRQERDRPRKRKSEKFKTRKDNPNYKQKATRDFSKSKDF